MKKTGLVILIIAMALAPVFAAGPTEQEVGDTLGGVMMVYALVVMGSMFGAIPEGAEVNMDPQSGVSSLVCDNLDVEALMSTEMGMGMTASMNGDDDIPEIEFTRMSGEISANEAGDMTLDVKLKGGPVQTLVLEMDQEDVVTFKADGKDYRYMTNESAFSEMFGE